MNRLAKTNKIKKFLKKMREKNGKIIVNLIKELIKLTI